MSGTASRHGRRHARRWGRGRRGRALAVGWGRCVGASERASRKHVEHAFCTTSNGRFMIRPIRRCSSTSRWRRGASRRAFDGPAAWPRRPSHDIQRGRTVRCGHISSACCFCRPRTHARTQSSMPVWLSAARDPASAISTPRATSETMLFRAASHDDKRLVVGMGRAWMESRACERGSMVRARTSRELARGSFPLAAPLRLCRAAHGYSSRT